MMDIIERLNDPEMYVDAVDDAIREIETLRARVAEMSELIIFISLRLSVYFKNQ